METPVDNFGVNFIFERALRRLDVGAEQRKLQQSKFDSHLQQLENDNAMLELKLTKKGKEFEQLHGKYANIQVLRQKPINSECKLKNSQCIKIFAEKLFPKKHICKKIFAKNILNFFRFIFKKQMVTLKTENDILEMKLQAELKNTHRLSRDVDNLQWSKNELLDMINHSFNIEKLRQKVMARRLY